MRRRAGSKPAELVAEANAVAKNSAYTGLHMADEAPDIYCDGVAVGLTPYDVLLELSRRPAKLDGKDSVHVGTVRMSLEHAKVLAVVLKRHLKTYEDQSGAIPMHPELMHKLGVSKIEDW